MSATRDWINRQDALLVVDATLKLVSAFTADTAAGDTFVADLIVANPGIQVKDRLDAEGQTLVVYGPAPTDTSGDPDDPKPDIDIEGPKLFAQDTPMYLVDNSKANRVIRIQNVGVTNYGLVHCIGGNETVILRNVFHTGTLGNSTDKPGCFFAMLWPQGADELYQCKRLLWDNTGLHDLLVAMGIDTAHEWMQQGSAEALFRMKCGEVHIKGVKFKGFLKDGVPWKQIDQFRSSKVTSVTTTPFVLVEDCEFDDGWVDLGEQKTAEPGGGSHYETAQQVIDIQFLNCTFHKLNGSVPYAKHPGVHRLRLTGCIGPGGAIPDYDHDFGGH